MCTHGRQTLDRTSFHFIQHFQDKAGETKSNQTRKKNPHKLTNPPSVKTMPSSNPLQLYGLQSIHLQYLAFTEIPTLLQCID